MSGHYEKKLKADPDMDWTPVSLEIMAWDVRTHNDKLGWVTIPGLIHKLMRGEILESKNASYRYIAEQEEETKP